jgi:hypothetical protein
MFLRNVCSHRDWTALYCLHSRTELDRLGYIIIICSARSLLQGKMWIFGLMEVTELEKMILSSGVGNVSIVG